MRSLLSLSSLALSLLLGPGFGLGCGGASSLPPHAADHPGNREADAGAPRHAHGGAHHHDFSDAEAFAELFDDPSRDEWQRPEALLSQMQLRPGQRVADLGAGTGYFLSRLSRAVGDSGRVFALDTEAAMVAHMRARIAEEGLENVEIREVEAADPGLEEASFDRILIVNTWHHIEDRGAYAALLLRALRPDGSIWIVDFTLESEHGPPVEMRLSAEQVLADFVAGGAVARILDEGLPLQYIVRATSP
ncbi:MAG: methyltransferase domain-containing protein [Myxococcales bacterium]|nr:methyltransferase domain-containing protein [Myxococcales bacterium]